MQKETPRDDNWAIHRAIVVAEFGKPQARSILPTDAPLIDEPILPRLAERIARELRKALGELDGLRFRFIRFEFGSQPRNDRQESANRVNSPSRRRELMTRSARPRPIARQNLSKRMKFSEGFFLQNGEKGRERGRGGAGREGARYGNNIYIPRDSRDAKNRRRSTIRSRRDSLPPPSPEFSVPVYICKVLRK